MTDFSTSIIMHALFYLRKKSKIRGRWEDDDWMTRKCLLVGKRKKMRIDETHRVRRIMTVSPLFCITLNHIIAFMCIDPRLHSFSRSRTLINRDVVQVGYQFSQISWKKSVIRVSSRDFYRIIERRAFFFSFSCPKTFCCARVAFAFDQM